MASATRSYPPRRNTDVAALLEVRNAEPKPKAVRRWRGDLEARRTVYGKRARLRSRVGKEALALRPEKVKRSFALILDRGGLRRTHVRGRENVHKRYVVHVAGYNLGQLIGAGIPKELAARGDQLLWPLDPDFGLPVILFLPPRPGQDTTSSAGCKTEPSGRHKRGMLR